MTDKECDLFQEHLKITDKHFKVQDKEFLESVYEDFPITDEVRNLFNTVSDAMHEDYGENLVDGIDFDKALIKEMSKKKMSVSKPNFEKLKYIYRIVVILQNNDLVRDAILKTANYKALLASGMNLTKGSTTVKGDVLLDKLPLSTVKNLFFATSRMALPAYAFDKNGKIKHKTFRLDGKLGRLRLAFRIPRSVAMIDPSGAIFSVVRAIERYSEEVQTYINSVVGPDALNLGGKGRKAYGMSALFGGTHEGITMSMLEKLDKTGDVDAAEQVQSILVRLMHNLFILDKDVNRILVYKRYAPVLDEKGIPRKYESGKTMFDFQDPIDLVSYLEGGDLKGEEKKSYKDGIALNKDMKFRIGIAKNLNGLNIETLNNKETIDSISENMEDMKEIMDEVHDTLQDEIEIVKRSFRKELGHWIRGIDIEVAYKAVLSGNTKGIPKSLKADVKFLFENFSRYNLFRILSDAPQELEKKGRVTFPIVYDDAKFITQMIPIEVIHDSHERLKKGVSEKEVDDLIAAIAWGHETMRKKLSQVADDVTDIGIATDKEMVHYKHITNMFDVRNARTDPYIFSIYAKRNFTVVQRGKLVVELMKAIRKIRANKRMSKGLKETLVHYIINSYRQVLNRPDTFAGIPGVIDMSFDNFYEGGGSGGQIAASILSPTINLPTKIYQHATGANKKQTFRFMKLMNKAVSALYLGSPVTAIQNSTAIIHKGIEMGFHNLREALSIYNQKVSVVSYSGGKKKKSMVSKRESYDKILTASGVLQFNDFFASSIVEDLSAQASFEANEQLFLIKSAIDFWRVVNKKTKKITNPDKRTAIMGAEFDKLFKKVGLNANIVKVIDLQLTKDLKREVKGIKREQFIGRLVNLSLAKTWNVAQGVAASDLDKYSFYLTKLLKKGIKSLSGLVENLVSFEFVRSLSMQRTEFFVRSLSGIMAINAGVKSGRIEHNPWEDKFNEEDMRIAVELVREAVRLMDHGMSPTDLGTWGWGQVMGSMMRFKGWGLQHQTTEVRWIIEAGVASSKDLEKSIEDKTLKDDMKYFFRGLEAAMKLLKGRALGKISYKESWKTVPETQRVLNFLLTSTLFSFLAQTLPMISGFWTLYRSMGLRSSYKLVTGMSSLVWNLFLVMPILLIKFANNDDEEDILTYLRYRVHSFTYHGWAIGQLINIIYTVMAYFDEDEEEFKKELKNFIPPIVNI